MSNEFKTVSDAEAIAWAERNDFQGSFVDLRAAIEDAQSIGTPHTAPPRVVDVELRKVVAAHIADLRRCVPIYNEHGLHKVATETALAIEELQAALEKPDAS